MAQKANAPIAFSSVYTTNFRSLGGYAARDGRVTKVLRVISRARGGVVFHCFAGKDRTGIIAMLLLLLAGVPEDTIVEDYCVSYENIKARFTEALTDVDPRFIHSKKEYMHALLAHFFEKHRDIDAYLRNAGLSVEEIQTLRDKLIG